MGGLARVGFLDVLGAERLFWLVMFKPPRNQRVASVLSRPRLLGSKLLRHECSNAWWGLTLLAVAWLLGGCRDMRGRRPILECTVVYAGAETRHVVSPTDVPYRVAPIDVAERFGFKAVYVDAPTELASFNVYVYAPSEHGSRLLHQLKFHAPFPIAAAKGRYGFTGLQLVYDANARELQYYCGFRRQVGTSQ